MARYFISGLMAFGLFASGVMAQQAAEEASDGSSVVQDGLIPGNHVARTVLNMNGYNITNLADPFFGNDAVNLKYFQENSKWNHIATDNMNFGGFDMKNIGDVTFDGSTLHGGTLDAVAINHPEITGGSLSGSSMRDSTLEAPEITGGTFESPAIVGPSIDGAIMTNTRISDMTVTGTVMLEGGRITGLLNPENDQDAMNRQATENLVNKSVARLETMINELKIEKSVIPPVPDVDDQKAARRFLKSNEEALPEFDVEARVLALELMLEEIMAKNHAVSTQYRPTPVAKNALGILGGSDIIAALREMNVIVYNLPQGGLATGIAPETIPSGMSFILRPGVDENELDSIDYVQLIGPLIATIQYLDARIQILEANMKQ